MNLQADSLVGSRTKLTKTAQEAPSEVTPSRNKACTAAWSLAARTRPAIDAIRAAKFSSATCARRVTAGEGAASAADSPEGVAVALEAGVKQGMLEASRVVVAPLLEAHTVGEVQQLASVGAATGGLFSFDIQTSSNALKEQPHAAAIAVRDEIESGLLQCA